MGCFLRSTGCIRLMRFCEKNLLLSLTIMSVVVGLVLGFALRNVQLSVEAVQLINFPGEIFLQVLKLMILPLIFSSLVSALAQLDAKAAGQMGLITVAYYGTTTILATITGIILVLTIHPGNPAIKSGAEYEAHEHTAVSPLDTFLDVIRNMFPENVIQAAMQRVQTSYYEHKLRLPPGLSNTTMVMMKKRIDYADGMNILGIIMFCTGFGIVISQFGERTRIIVDFFVILEAVIMKLVETFMWLAPLGIVCLIAGNLLELDDLSETLTVLLMYVITVLAGLTIHTLITMPLLYFALTRRNPLTIVHGMAQALVTAFGTASGGAALPVSMQCMEDNLKVDRRITRFVLPLGSTINMDGNALYEAVAVIFIAQLNGVTLSIPEVITVSLIATIASLGLNSVPAGLVSILLILNTVDLPTKDVSLLITVDWLIDRVRTAVNVLGDAFAASVVARYLQAELEKMDEHNEFHHEIREEIEMLRSASTSHRPSLTGSPLLSDAEMGGRPGLVGARSKRQSRCHSVDVLSWKDHAILSRLQQKISLPPVRHL